MGIDIQGVIETEFNGLDLSSHPCGFAYWEWPRHRGLFERICTKSVDCVIPKRGFPVSTSFFTLVHYGIEVVGDDQLDHSEWETMSESMAMELIDNEECELLDFSKTANNWVNNPANQYANWMTLSELESACKLVNQSIAPIPAETNATIAAMRTLENEGVQCRLVYWFDV